MCGCTQRARADARTRARCPRTRRHSRARARTYSFGLQRHRARHRLAFGQARARSRRRTVCFQRLTAVKRRSATGLAACDSCDSRCIREYGSTYGRAYSVGAAPILSLSGAILCRNGSGAAALSTRCATRTSGSPHPCLNRRSSLILSPRLGPPRACVRARTGTPKSKSTPLMCEPLRHAQPSAVNECKRSEPIHSGRMVRGLRHNDRVIVYFRCAVCAA